MKEASREHHKYGQLEFPCYLVSSSMTRCGSPSPYHAILVQELARPLNPSPIFGNPVLMDQAMKTEKHHGDPKIEGGIRS